MWISPAAGVLTTLLMVAGLSPVSAAFLGSTTNGANTFGSAASFSTYPTSVGNSAPWAYHRGEEAMSSAATSAATDSSGNSRPGTYASQTNGPTLHWDFNEGSGTTLHDSSGTGHDGVVYSNGGWSTGLMGSSGLTGQNAANGTAQGGSNPDPIRPDQSFTISVWTNMTAASTSNRGVVNMTGKTSGTINPRSDLVILHDYNGGSPRWAFWMAQDPSSNTNTTWDRATGTSAVAINAWTHLTVVYDTTVAGGTMYLYVNGTLEATTTHTPLNNSASPVSLELGRYRSTAWGYTYNGAYDEVRAYKRVLSSTEIGNLSKSLPESRWDFSESSGTTTADAAASNNDATLGSATTFVAGHAGNALQMNNSANGYAQTARQSLQTNRSFSVSAWAYLNSAGTGVYRTVLSENGSLISAFYLQVQTSGKWAFAVPQSDSTSASSDQVISTAVATTNTWVHLVGVYDDNANTVRLYVNGTSQGSVTRNDVNDWNAVGPLQIGRGEWNTAYADAWYGKIDSVRTYQRALSSTEVTSLYNDTNPAAPFTEAGMTAGITGALQGSSQGLQATTAIAFGGISNAYNNTSVVSTASMASTTECWFRTTTTTGGALIGFTNNQTGLNATNKDRIIYLDDTGRVQFHVHPTGPRTITSPSPYNNGNWHHVAASIGPAGQKLYVDGALVASDLTTTTADNFTGYWRWGGLNLNLSGGTLPTSYYFTGTIDEVAIYYTQLTDKQISDHYLSNH